MYKTCNRHANGPTFDFSEHKGNAAEFDFKTLQLNRMKLPQYLKFHLTNPCKLIEMFNLCSTNFISHYKDFWKRLESGPSPIHYRFDFDSSSYHYSTPIQIIWLKANVKTKKCYVDVCVPRKWKRTFWLQLVTRNPFFHSIFFQVFVVSSVPFRTSDLIYGTSWIVGNASVRT